MSFYLLKITLFLNAISKPATQMRHHCNILKTIYFTTTEGYEIEASFTHSFSPYRQGAMPTLPQPDQREEEEVVGRNKAIAPGWLLRFVRPVLSPNRDSGSLFHACMPPTNIDGCPSDNEIGESNKSERSGALPNRVRNLQTRRWVAFPCHRSEGLSRG